MFEKKTVRETAALLRTDDRRGLSAREAAERLEQDGRNELALAKRRTVLQAFLEQLADPLIYVLFAAAAVSVLLREYSDAGIILFVVGLNALVGLLQEGKAQRALDSLKELTRPRAFVIRDGREQEISASALVRGDLVVLRAGGQVPADLRLTEAEQLRIEESALTGEAVPAVKATAIPEGAGKRKIPLGDRQNMAFMSTIVTAGRGKGLVTAVGMDTQIGRIAAMMSGTKEEMTPLQKRLGELGKVLSLLSLGICAALFLLAVWQQRDVFEMLLTAISLAVAAVPEGLPAVVTLCLALSVTRMVKVNTIVRRLPSVETLGAVSVVCSDKTGTLTQNRMTVQACFADRKKMGPGELDREEQAEFLRAMALCCDASLLGERIGDPTELALLDLAARYGLCREKLEESRPRIGELAFDSDRKMMTTLHRGPSGPVAYTKGAPDRVLGRCTRILYRGRETEMTAEHRTGIEKALAEFSGQALRTLAVARKTGTSGAERELTFLGLVGMRDPVRPEAARAVEDFERAGIAAVMITGDHADTALAVGKQLGIAACREQCMTGQELEGLSGQKLAERLLRVRVFARVSPADKVKIVRAFQEQGKIVAMTGDGINDAPSLKAADVGVAMGKGGTDVARQAADLILTDDNFATIQKAVREGRSVYENIKKSVIFLLSSNLGEIMTMFAAVLLGLSSPLKSSHILWINLITDSLPALALGVDKNDGESLMRRPPRKAGESLFAEGGLAVTAFFGALIAGVSLTAYFTLPWVLLEREGIPFLPERIRALLEDGRILTRAQTYAFTVLGMSQLFHAVGMRDVRRSVFRMNHLENRLMIVACAAGLVLQVAVTEVPFLVKMFSTARLSLAEWLYLAGLAAFPLLAHELLALFGGPGRREPEPDISGGTKSYTEQNRDAGWDAGEERGKSA
ncbi:MAG: cation-translocating P-type ATPase [Eubacteriales bacterium]|nr:cation-translocating P-type ATPase [Eubacteriales bacterium]